MASPSPLMIMWASLLLLLLFSATSPCVAGGQFAGLNRITSKRRTIRHVTHFRGGAFVDSDEEYDSDEYDSDDEDEPIVAKAKKLASSTKNKVQKAKGAAAKAKVSVAMASSGGGDGGLGGLYRHYVPYIIRACLNPFTLLSMTKGYFISLFDINYLREEPSQNLRSALDAKAKQGGGGPPKPKRKMRPGQAKTLSDLPQLSA